MCAGRLHNSDGANPDALFVGSGAADQAMPVSVEAASALACLLERQASASEADRLRMLGSYGAILYTESAVVRMVTRSDYVVALASLHALANVARRYDFSLPLSVQRFASVG